MPKINRKLVISVLALAAGTSLIGSATGTVAWYQYNVRAQAAYSGAAAHCSKLLQISCDDGATWGNDLDIATIQDNTIGGTKFAPITTGAQEKDEPLKINPNHADQNLFYGSPLFGRESYDSWEHAPIANYARFTLNLKVTDINKELNPLTNDIYLTDLTIKDSTTTQDIADAVRIHFKVTSTDENDVETVKYFLFARNAEETAVGGALDLNNDGHLDKVQGYEWEWGDEGAPICIYGEENAVQTSYKANDPNIIPVEDENMELSGGEALGQTGETPLKIEVTIWLEGWAELLHGLSGNASGESETAIWDSSKYVANAFLIGMSFGTKLHADNE